MGWAEDAHPGFPQRFLSRLEFWTGMEGIAGPQVSDLAWEVIRIPDFHPIPPASSRETQAICEGSACGERADLLSWVSRAGKLPSRWFCFL